MKMCFFIWIFILFQVCSYVLGETCMSLSQVNVATGILCRQQRHNKTLWQQVIDCHIPISDEFMRESGEAQCPNPKHVEDPTDTKYTIQDVFFNICGIVDGSFFQKISSGICLIFGKSPSVMSHSSEVAAVQKTWGADVPCNIGKCILRLGLNN